MVSDAAVRSSAAAVVTTRNRPMVAVFFAGATGIGHYTLRELARLAANTPGASGIRAYIVARKESVAQEVIAECSAIIRQGVSGVTVAEGNGSGEHGSQEPTAEFEFVQTSDLSLMGEVDRVCARIHELETARATRGGEGDVARIDYLLFTQGPAPYQPRKETKEGLDFTMAMLYYSRMRAITQLLPMLLAASAPPSAIGTDSNEKQHHATIVSVYAAGIEDTFDPANLALDVNPEASYSYNTARSHMVYMHTFFFEQLALSHDNLALVHVFPGLVDGPAFTTNKDLPAWFRTLWGWVVVPLFGWAVLTRAEDCGRRLLSLADAERYPPARDGGDGSGASAAVRGTTGEIGGGTYALGSTMDDTFKSAKYEGMDRDAMRKRVWQHTMDVFDTIAGGKIFKGEEQSLS
ncbi:hypothetical protein Micbo1qcDRAFT_194700 [Microdochium bolleyi]|uniref:Uncharacterized protein n=1 Tax=Microdochium bolleyi TaxID=196109 RepID=A0A136J8U4_9PEZI|nr:hypothetical protein Micbo1qcDRAFT_194700 [Microdochium bolleyi]